jgi:hypothetical protein
MADPNSRWTRRCTDNTVLRIKFTQGNTMWFHKEVWSLLAEKLAPVLNLSVVQKVLPWVVGWFTGERRP